jgi:hypothetical protein
MPDKPEFDGVLEDLEGLDERNIRDLIDRSGHIQNLTTHPGWIYYQDYLIAITGALQNVIISGSCKNLEDYRVKTGYLQGIRAAIEAPERLQQRVLRIQENLTSDDEQA